VAEFAEMTQAGFVIRNGLREHVASLTWIEGVGEGLVLVMREGAEPLEIGLDLDGLAHLANVAGTALRNAKVAAETACVAADTP
jgi:hypothetical protein